jgi:hypothetical protein
MSSSVSKQIKKLQEKLAELKVGLDKKKTVEECTKKRHLENFSVVELIAWLTHNKISFKKLLKKHKRDFIELVWETLEEDFETGSDTDSDSDSETESESDSE